MIRTMGLPNGPIPSRMLHRALKNAWFVIFAITIPLSLSCKSATKAAANGDTQMPLDGEEAIPRKYKTIYIHNFENNSRENGLTGTLKQALVVRFSMDKRLKVESNKETADLWLYGVIDIFEEFPVDYDQFGEPQQYRYSIVATVWVRPNSASSQENLFDKKTVRFDTTYQPRTPPYESEFTAKERLLNGLANRILKQVLTGWYSDLKSNEELGYDKEKR